MKETWTPAIPGPRDTQTLDKRRGQSPEGREAGIYVERTEPLLEARSKVSTPGTRLSRTADGPGPSPRRPVGAGCTHERAETLRPRRLSLVLASKMSCARQHREGVRHDLIHRGQPAEFSGAIRIGREEVPPPCAGAGAPWAPRDPRRTHTRSPHLTTQLSPSSVGSGPLWDLQP